MGMTENTATKTEFATFGAGCFWQVEEQFRELDGVIDTAVGYEGGERREPHLRAGLHAATPATSRSAGSSTTRRKIDYADLVQKYFEIHDPTQLNRQGPDVGWQYRSVIFTEDEAQAETARKVLDANRDRFRDEIVTEITPGEAVLARRGVPPVLSARSARPPAGCWASCWDAEADSPRSRSRPA